MSSLRDRQQRQQAERQMQDQGTWTGAEQTNTRATWAPPYPTPIHGQVDGEPVRILQIGDMPGQSPVYLCVDEDGFSAPVKLNDVQITDGAFLPLKQPRGRQQQLARQ